eukprot:1160443-Pelagomonas_calceolata.AAC.8
MRARGHEAFSMSIMRSTGACPRSHTTGEVEAPFAPQTHKGRSKHLYTCATLHTHLGKKRPRWCLHFPAMYKVIRFCSES